ncbi:MAG TPA: hypothetical protein VNW15_14360 [Rhizomicrobium sp.]|nr:hypothetical protein [Rhizomicrobium sp.]
MILRGAFWMGLTWMFLALGPVAGLPSMKSLHPDCESCEAPAGDAWRRAVLQRLQALKAELKTEGHESPGNGEAVRTLASRLADADAVESQSR